jgi:hypothetical protein
MQISARFLCHGPLTLLARCFFIRSSREAIEDALRIF